MGWQRIADGQTGHDAAWQLLESMYRRLTGEKMPAVERTALGKPYFVDAPWHFSLSHTKRHAFCVLAARPVGIDAEEMDRPIRLELAKKILSSGEKLRYEAAQDPRTALLKLWVLKEAQKKCTGQGLQPYPRDTEFSLEDPRVQEIDGCLVAVVEA